MRVGVWRTVTVCVCVQHPDKIPTGTMTTFVPIAKIVAGGKSRAKNAVTKVDGRTWKKEFDLVRGIEPKM